MQRKATAVWRGDVISGKGSLSTESTILKEAQYSFSTRFENGIGTNPEELLAAAHAGCYAMAVSSQLGKAGLKLEATATVTFEKVGEHFAITKSHLDLLAHVPARAKRNSMPPSKLLRLVALCQDFSRLKFLSTHGFKRRCDRRSADKDERCCEFFRGKDIFRLGSDGHARRGSAPNWLVSFGMLVASRDSGR